MPWSWRAFQPRDNDSSAVVKAPSLWAWVFSYGLFCLTKLTLLSKVSFTNRPARNSIAILMLKVEPEIKTKNTMTLKPKLEKHWSHGQHNLLSTGLCELLGMWKQRGFQTVKYLLMPAMRPESNKHTRWAVLALESLALCLLKVRVAQYLLIRYATLVL